MTGPLPPKYGYYLAGKQEVAIKKKRFYPLGR